ncbi:OVARIAN TUMOR DOMAIN-containing deubiquitinating enzyme 12 (OTU domain-containing protein 12) (Deubiquitinating enzyme OTU12) [Durusdinium trenchii]|uniref:OVARIAN TUMOR DOMAIN-containing deubiquitinating enzyme 12 (OTU domain-containing protein 12) (Deubiquitinating enzyme OTU12) n=1 Tax=Durusdinium trenchii TaxID=1381693 RepID=A0ABP0RVM1_9DINO
MLAALEEHGLEEVEMVGDGNCQFRALAHQWFGSEEHHASLRTAVVQQLKDWPERYKVWETAEFDYEFWVDRMALDGVEWGTGLTLRAAADLLGAEIHVFEDDLSEGQMYIHYEPSEKTTTRVLRLVFRSRRGHYNSVREIRAQ